MASGLRDLVAKLRLDTTEFSKGLRGVAGKLKVVGAAMTAASVGVAYAIKGQLDAADEMSKSASKFGVPIETLSKLKYAADMSGVSMETLGTGLRKLSQKMVDAAGGGKASIKLFEDIGVSATNADGSLRGSEEVMQDVADVLAKMPDGAAKTALAMDLFGKAGAEMIPMLNGGSSALGEMMREAESLGIVFDKKTGDAAQNFNDNISRLQGAVRGLVVQLAAALAPTLEVISAKAVEMTKWFRDLSPATQALAAKFAVVAMAAGPVLIGLGMVVGSLGTLSAALKVVAALALANPIGIAIAAIAAGAALIYLNWDGISAWFSDKWQAVKEVTLAAWEGIKSLIATYSPAAILYRNWDRIADYFSQKLAEIPAAFTAAWEQVKAVTAQWYADFLAIGGHIVDGLKQGIQDKWDAMVDWFGGLTAALVGRAESEFDTHSPSRVFRAIGQFITQGLGLGIADNAPMATGAMDDVLGLINGQSGSLTEGMTKFRDSARSTFVSVVTGSQKAGAAIRQMAQSWLQSKANSLAGLAFDGIAGLLGFAKGGAFQNGRVMPFAKGGVVSGPTNFAMRGGLGLMGEAGPEAIMPLTRGAGGKLGVQAVGGGGVVEIRLAAGLEASMLDKAAMQSVRIVQGAAPQIIGEAQAATLKQLRNTKVY